MKTQGDIFRKLTQAKEALKKWILSEKGVGGPRQSGI